MVFGKSKDDALLDVVFDLKFQAKQFEKQARKVSVEREAIA